jgi:hypothetical protein
MTREDIIRMARNIASQATHGRNWTYEYAMSVAMQLVEAGAAAEREACAKVCDDKHDTWRWDDEPDSASGPRDCAAAIRARGQA